METMQQPGHQLDNDLRASSRYQTPAKDASGRSRFLDGKGVLSSQDLMTTPMTSAGGGQPNVVTPESPWQIQKSDFLHKSISPADKRSQEHGFSSNGMVDQYKKTIDALNAQVDFLRKREERYMKEIERFKKNESDGGKEGVNQLREIQALEADRDQHKFEAAQAKNQLKAVQDENKILQEQVTDARETMQTFSNVIDELEYRVRDNDDEHDTLIDQLRQELQTKENKIAEIVSNYKTQIQALEDDLSKSKSVNTKVAELEFHKKTLQNQLIDTTQQRDFARDNEENLKTRLQLVEKQYEEYRARFNETSLQDIEHSLESKYDSANMKLRRELATLTNRLKERETRIIEQEMEIQNLVSKAETLRSTKEHFVSSSYTEHNRLETENEQFKTQVQSLQSKLLTQSGAIEEKNHRITSLMEEVANLRASTSKRNSDVIMSTLRSELVNIRSNLRSQFEKERVEFINQLQALESQLGNAKRELLEKAHQVQNFEATQASLKSEKNDLVDKVTQLQFTIKAKENDIDSLKLELRDMKECRDTINGTLASGLKDLLDDGELRAAHEAVNKLHEENESLKGELDIVRRKLRELARVEDDLTRTRMDSEELKEKNQTLQHSLQQAKLQLVSQTEWIHDREETDRRLSTYQDKIRALESQQSDLENKLKAGQEERDRMQRRVEQTCEENSQVTIQLSTSREEYKAMKRRVENLTEELNDAKEQLVETGRKILECNATISGLRRDVLVKEQRIVEQSQLLRTTDEAIAQIKEHSEKTLALEKQKANDELAKLVKRIYKADELNQQLDQRLQSLMSRFKQDQNESTALRANLKHYREQVKEQKTQLDQAMTSLHNKREGVDQLKQQVKRLKTSMHEGHFQKQLQHLEDLVDEKGVLLEIIQSDLSKCQRERQAAHQKIEAMEEAHRQEAVSGSRQQLRVLSDQLHGLKARLENTEMLVRQGQLRELELQSQLKDRAQSIQKLQNAIRLLKSQHTSQVNRLTTSRTDRDHESHLFHMEGSQGKKPMPGNHPPTSRNPNRQENDNDDGTTLSKEEDMEKILSRMENLAP